MASSKVYFPEPQLEHSLELAVDEYVPVKEERRMGFGERKQRVVR